MPYLRVENLYKIFGPDPERAIPMIEEGVSKEEILDRIGCTVAVNDNSFEVEQGETFVVMGLSGSGKSTLLRLLNRLIEPTAGDVWIGDINVSEASAEEMKVLRRDKTSMVFQHFGLLPHRTVSENVSFGLEIQGVGREERREAAYRTIEQVGLKGYEKSMTAELSGGMQQRVGLARALATDPEILLMDEAFSALDPLIRTEMQNELLDLQAEMQKTIIFITHDLDEALKLGDRIVIMKDGRIEQVGTSEDILTDPASDYVAAFVQNVDRSKIITARAIMFDRPEKLVSPRDGPGVAVRRMRELGIESLPVTDAERRFQGLIHIDDAVGLRRQEKRTLDEAIDEEVPTCSPDTAVSDLLPLVWDSHLPVSVLGDDGKLEGVVTRPSIIAEIMGPEHDGPKDEEGEEPDNA
jgi:glycine betaine/proline transport system ATP-binding protein